MGLGLKALFDLITNRRVFILGYHSIADEPSDPWALSPDMFASQMNSLARQKCHVVSLTQAVSYLEQGKTPGKPIVITFDDGNADFVQNAVPILKQYEFPATLFVPAGEIGKASSWRDPEFHWPLVDWDNLRETVRLGHSIGSHGFYHRDLTSVDTLELSREVVESKCVLEDGLGIPIDLFACPFARCGQREALAIERAGYGCSCGPGAKRGNGPETDRFMLTRVFVQAHSWKDFDIQTTGRAALMSRARSIFFRPARWAKPAPVDRSRFPDARSRRRGKSE